MTRTARCSRGPAGPPLWVLLAVALATVPAGCGDDRDGGDGRAATTTTTEDATAGWVTCESPANGYRVDHPPGWTTNAGDVMPPCSLFHPGPFDVPEQTEIPTDIAVAITVEPEPGGDPDAGGLGERVLSEEEATVDGRPATRTEVEATGDALYPEGQRTTRWTVAVDGGRIVAQTHDRGEPAYDDKQEILDRMVASLTVVDGDAAEPVGEPGLDEAASGDFPAGFNGDTAFVTDVRVAALSDPVRLVVDVVSHRGA